MKKTIISLLILICTAVFALAQEPTSPKLKELDAKIQQKDARYGKTSDFYEQKKLGAELNALRQQRSQEVSRLQAADGEKWIKDQQNISPQQSLEKITRYITMAVSFLAFGGIVALLIWLALRRKEPPHSDAHGTARFADLDELKAEKILRKNLEINTGDFIIGECNEGHLVLPWERTVRHELIIGVTSSGKTLSIICPNIVKSTGESLFISDVKRHKGTTNGELWERTSGYRKKAYYFSPLEPKKNMLKFNWIPALRGDVVTAKLFADAVVFSSEGAKNAGSNAFWYEAGRDLLAATWLHAAETNDPTPANAYHILMMRESELIKLLENSHASEARLAARTYLDAPDKTSGNILSTARNSFSFMQSKEIQHFTYTPNATDFSALRREEIAIYYQARTERKALLQPLNCLILTYMFTQLKETDGLMVKFILDEFANFGKIPDFAGEITLLRDKNMPIIAAVQTLRSQIESIYGRNDTDTILTNFNNQMCFAGLDAKSAREVSEAMGKYTYIQQKVSVSDGGLFDKSTSKSIQEHGRELMTGDEITRMSKREILVFHLSEMHPFKAWKIPYKTEDKAQPIKERELRQAKTTPFLQLPSMFPQEEIHIPPMPDFDFPDVIGE
jgi:type IV secretory pathway TraG/TraD family ATPase VirD4